MNTHYDRHVHVHFIAGYAIPMQSLLSWSSYSNLHQKAVSNFSQKRFLTDPHQAVGVVRFALVLDAAEAVAPLAVVSLVVVVEFYLPHSLKETGCHKL